MQCDRRAQLEKRRRRVLRDDAGAPPRAPATRMPARSNPPTKAQSYTAAARADCQPRITDLIPRRPLTLLAIVLCGLTAVVGLETLYACRTTWTRWLTTADLAALDLSAAGSLGAWFSSFTLMGAAFYAALVFNIRRHKLDDYRGRYGLWLWAMVTCIVASIDCTAGVHQAVRGVAVALTGTPLWADGNVWWISCGVLLSGIVALRVAMDMRRCPVAYLSLAGAGACYLVATLVYFGLVYAVDDIVTVMMRSAALLLGHVALAFSFVVYARHVFLDAQGQLHIARDTDSARPIRLRIFSLRGHGDSGSPPVSNRRARPQLSKPASPADRKSAPTEESERKPSVSAGRPVHPPPQEPVSKAAVGSSQPGDGDAGGSPSVDTTKLSKAQRRRLRKQQRRQRQAA